MAGKGSWTADPSFDRYARLVRRALDVPVALVSIVEANRQVFPGAVGLPDPYQVARETPLSHSMCQFVVADEAPLVVADVRTDPRLADNLAVDDLGVVAYAGWPLTDHTGRTVGSLCAIDGRPREWSAEDLETLADLAGACSAEIALRELSRSAQAQSLAALELADHQQLLLAFSESLSAADTFEHIATALEKVAVEELGCANAGMWLLSSLTPDTASPDDLAAAARSVLRFVPTERDDWLRAKTFGEFEPDPSTPLGHVYTSGSSLFFSDQRSQDERFPNVASGEPDAGGRAVVPLTIGSRLIGCLGLTWPHERSFSEDDRVGLLTLASYLTQAVNRAVVLQDRVDSSNTLQSAMLTPLPDPDGLTISARYQPAAKREQVGGDWYDAFELATGATAVVIGDVVGHDLEAAAAMGQVRSILRAIAWPGEKRPADSLESLDQALAGLQLDVLATLVYGRLEAADARGERLFTWAAAGHPPPLLLHADGSHTWLEDGSGPMIGIKPEYERSNATVTLPRGSTLVLYTDGLVERRREILDVGLARLASVCRERPGLPVDELIGDIFGALVDAESDDDVAVVVVRNQD